jgi:hypothetical protein
MTREGIPEMMDEKQWLYRSFWPLTSSLTLLLPPKDIPDFQLALTEKVRGVNAFVRGW